MDNESILSALSGQNNNLNLPAPNMGMGAGGTINSSDPNFMELIKALQAINSMVPGYQPGQRESTNVLDLRNQKQLSPSEELEQVFQDYIRRKNQQR